MKRLKTREEQERERARLDEILILLEQLFNREEATAKTLIGCLYDIATVNWINKNIPLWGINTLLKKIVVFPRPLAKVLGLKLYLQPKCPRLIANWLYSLVEFKEGEEIESNSAVAKNSFPEISKSRQEILLLRRKVRLLTGALIMTVAAFGVSFAWIAYSLELRTSPGLEQTSSHLDAFCLY